MSVSKDRVTLLILITGTYGLAGVSFWLFESLPEYILTGVIYAFFLSVFQRSERYLEYINRTPRKDEFQNLLSKLDKKSPSQILIANLFNGVVLGVVLFTLKTISQILIA